MKTNIEKLIKWMEEEGSDFLTVDTILMKAKSLSQESDWVSVEEIVKDIHFLRDKAEHPLVEIAYNMAVTVVKSHYYKNTLPNKPKQ